MHISLISLKLVYPSGFFLHKQTEVDLHVVFEGLKDKKIRSLGI